MAATQKLYPRATVKRVVKAHSNRNLSKNADILVSHQPLSSTAICPSSDALPLYRSSWITCCSCKSESTSLLLDYLHSTFPRSHKKWSLVGEQLGRERGAGC